MLGRPSYGLGHAVGVDELLERPVERVGCGARTLEHTHEEAVRERKPRGVCCRLRAVALFERVVKEPVHPLDARLHAKIAAQEL